MHCLFVDYINRSLRLAAMVCGKVLSGEVPIIFEAMPLISSDSPFYFLTSVTKHVVHRAS